MDEPFTEWPSCRATDAKFDRELVIDAARWFICKWGPVPAWSSSSSKSGVRPPRYPTTGAQGTGLPRLNIWEPEKLHRPLEQRQSQSDRVFSLCRLDQWGYEDLRAAARIADGYKVSTKVSRRWCSGSAVKEQAETEASISFSARLVSNGASQAAPWLAHEPRYSFAGRALRFDSNRTFEGRQGRGDATHL